MNFIDTNILIDLDSGRSFKKLTRKAQKLIEQEDLYISPYVLVEIQILYELGRLKYTPEEIFENVSVPTGLRIDETLKPQKLIKACYSLSWTRDPFDRLITAHAMARKRPLITRDEKILEHYADALW